MDFVKLLSLVHLGIETNLFNFVRKGEVSDCTVAKLLR